MVLAPFLMRFPPPGTGIPARCGRVLGGELHIVALAARQLHALADQSQNLVGRAVQLLFPVMVEVPMKVWMRGRSAGLTAWRR